nr:MAG TPA: hypothetical protein [Caudoviricetes sp.]
MPTPTTNVASRDWAKVFTARSKTPDQNEARA